MYTIISAEEFDIGAHDDSYQELRDTVQRSFLEEMGLDGEQLFRTDATGLFQVYLESLPEGIRQQYNCSCCRSFIHRYGGLVRVDDSGKTHAVMWSREPSGVFAIPVRRMREIVEKAHITGTFEPAGQLGYSQTGPWKHLMVQVPQHMVHRADPCEVEAAKNQEYTLLGSAVGKCSTRSVETAVNLLRSGTLYRGDQVLGRAEWFLDVLNRVHGNRNGRNLLWKAAASAPAGFCHITSGVLGTLLEDIMDGLKLEEIQRRFREKMDPTQYQRPQALPKEGNVRRAEELAEKLQLANALKRRFARLEEIQTLWRAPSLGGREGGVFAGVPTRTAKTENDALTPRANMTWVKFRDTVLPRASKIEFLVKPGRDNFCAIVTAEDPEAVPILQWDSPERRNPFSIYVYRGGSTPDTWGLTPGYCKVTAVTLQPSLWQPGFEFKGKSVIFVLEGCRDRRNSGLALFPEILKSEFHEIRATIEAYSDSHSLSGFEEASACGFVLFGSANSWSNTFRVTTGTGTTIYTLDRWD